MLLPTLPPTEDTLQPAKLDIRRFGRVLSQDREPTTDKGEPLSQLVSAANPAVVVLVGKSGCGKTTAIFDLAFRRGDWVLYFDWKLCPLTDPLEKSARTYYEQLKQSNTHASIQTLQSRLRDNFRYRMGLHILARLLHLRVLLVSNPQLTASDHLADQLNGGQVVIGQFLAHLERLTLDSSVLEQITQAVKADIMLRIAHGKLVLAGDEAQLLLHKLNGGEVISDNALGGAQPIDLTTWRSMFTLVCYSWRYTGMPIVLAGTSLSLGTADVAFSAVAKSEGRFAVVNQFPQCSDPHALLGALVNLNGCTISNDHAMLLSGRYRIATSVVEHLCGLKMTNKQAALTSAIESALTQTQAELTLEIVKYTHTDATLRTAELVRIYRSWLLAGKPTNLSWLEPPGSQFDQLAAAVCSISQIGFANQVDESGHATLAINEPLMFKVLGDKLETHCKIANLAEPIKLLQTALKALGNNTSVKGNLLEPVVREALKLFNGVTVADFVLNALHITDLELPEWCSTSKFNINEIGGSSANAGSGRLADDLAFLLAPTPGKLLVPNNLTRPDSVCFLDGPGQHAVALGLAFFLGSVPTTKVADNTKSTDLRMAFSVDGETSDQTRATREEYMAKGGNMRNGTLRIHVLLPRGAGKTPAPSVDLATGDVLIFIDMSNLNLLFGGNTADPHIVALLKQAQQIISEVYVRPS